jgi:membrane dipeptidase
MLDSALLIKTFGGSMAHRPQAHALRERRRLACGVFVSLAALGASPSLPAQDDAALVRAREILRRVPLVDGHNDTPWLIREAAGSDVAKYDLRKRTAHETDLARLRAGQVGAQFWSVWIPSVDSGSARTQLEQIDLAHRMIAAYPEALVLATRAADVAAAHRAGKIASFLGMENGRALENSLGPLRAYFDLGVRYMTLTHGRRTDWADSATDEAKHGGLTPFGKEVVREMNRLGMLVDLSHVSPAVMHQALDVSEAPVIFSHSSAFGVTPHPRNVPDDVLRRLAKNGGLVMVTFIPGFVSRKVMDWEAPLMTQLQGATAISDFERLEKEREKVAGPKPKATIADVADHIEHAARMAGVDHVGIGSDFAGVGMPEGLEDTSRYPYLFAELVRRGWKDADLEKLAGSNLVRALAQAETVAARLQRERPPSTATLEALDGGRR